MSSTLETVPYYPQVLRVGNKLYCRCLTCGDVIRLNKPILGSLHLCLTDEEIKQRRSKWLRP